MTNSQPATPNQGDAMTESNATTLVVSTRRIEEILDAIRDLQRNSDKCSTFAWHEGPVAVTAANDDHGYWRLRFDATGSGAWVVSVERIQEVLASFRNLEERTTIKTGSVITMLAFGEGGSIEVTATHDGWGWLLAFDLDTARRLS